MSTEELSKEDLNKALADKLVAGVGLYNSPYALRKAGEMDLIQEAYIALLLHTDQRVADHFLNWPSIADAKNKNPVIQQVIINAFLTETLFQYRSVTDTSITSILTYIVDNITPVEWLEVFKIYLCPYLAENRVIERVYFMDIASLPLPTD